MPEENDDYAIDPAFKQINKNAICFLIWRVENMQLVAIPKDQYGIFYEGDSYLIYAASEFGKFVGPGTKIQEVRGRLEVHIHFWLGAETSKDESTIAAYKCVELDTYLGGTPTQHREIQNQESPRFKGYFKKGIRLLKGGVASGLHHVDNPFITRLFCVKGRRSPTIKQMPAISWEYFNSANVYILDTKEITFIWVGRHANNMEKLQAASVGQDIRDEHGGLSLVFVDDGKENELPESEKTVFSLYLNPKNRYGLRTDMNEEENTSIVASNPELKLYKCVDDGGTYRIFQVKVGPLIQSDLTSDDTYIVDKYGQTIWVWLGKKASKKDRIDAIRNAHGFVKKKNYPSHIPVCRVIEGGEPIEFKLLFSSWRDSDANNNFAGMATTNTYVNVKTNVIPANLNNEILYNNPKISSHLQLMDDGCGKLSIWRLKHAKLKDVPYFMYGRFYSKTCYIVHYKYVIDTKECHVLYCWIGSYSTKTDQTAAMIHILSKNESVDNTATLVYLNEGKETPHFLSIFRGRLTTFIDEHKDEIPSRFLLHVTGSRLYNTSARQVPIKASNLDSSDVFILHCNEKVCYVWCGKSSTGDQREMAKNIANKISSAEELNVIYEGQEKNEFWNQIGAQTGYKHSNKKELLECTSIVTRLFHSWNTTNNTLKLEEVMNFQQNDLISEDIMLLDAKPFVLYLWIGNIVKNEDAKHAHDIAIEHLKNDTTQRDLQTPVIIVREGHEPSTFIGFFESWDHEASYKRKSFAEIRQDLEKQNPILHIELKSVDENYNFEECEKYPLEKLLIKNPEKLPFGVDPSHKELHLTHDEFYRLFQMKYAEFSQLAKWKRDNMKKMAGLF